MIGSIFNAKEYSSKPKATIQLSGKLGFNCDAIVQLKITEDKGIVMAPDSSDKRIYYLAVVDKENEQAFPARKSGQYYYINSKQLFDKLDLNYEMINYIFDLIRCEKFDTEIGGECYKMTMRLKPRTPDDVEEK